MKTIYLKENDKVRQVTYCPFCCTKADAVAYIREYAYFNVPCRCRMADWQKQLKKKFKKKLKEMPKK